MRTSLIRRRGQQAISLYRDREFYQRLFQFALPIIIQNIITSSLSLVGVIMIGQMGDTPVAAVGLANQVFFLLNLLLFGVNSGAAIYTSQLWGIRDIANIHKVLGLALTLGLIGSGLFLLVSVFTPQVIIGLYSPDPAVITQGSQFLRIFGISFPFIAVTFAYSVILRSVGDVKTPLYVSISALSLNCALSYLLIFGKLGLPALGVPGAALATLLARIIEMSSLLILTYTRRERSPAAARIREMFSYDLAFAQVVFRKMIPVIFNETLWSLGITMYNVIYARIGTESLAAVNIALTIDNLAVVLFVAISVACSILVGNTIGEGNNRKAFDYAFQTLSISAAGSVLMGILIISGSGLILQLYKVSPQVLEYARAFLYVISGLLWVRVANMVLFVGIFRAGGDTRFAFILDVGSIWVVGVPMALIGAFVLHMPVYLVYLMALSDEVFKLMIGMTRFLSRKWINNVTQMA